MYVQSSFLRCDTHKPRNNRSITLSNIISQHSRKITESQARLPKRDKTHSIPHPSILSKAKQHNALYLSTTYKIPVLPNPKLQVSSPVHFWIDMICYADTTRYDMIRRPCNLVINPHLPASSLTPFQHLNSATTTSDSTPYSFPSPPHSHSHSPHSP